MKDTLQLRLGMLLPPIVDQLADQGLGCTVKEAEHFEMVRKSIGYLYLHDFISTNTKTASLTKLTKLIAKTAKPLE